MKQAVGYVRVSLAEQADGHSLDAQRREIERYCERQGYELARFYADEGVSAHGEEISKRPQLAALLDDADRGSFDLVIVHTLDRWARNIRVQSAALQRLGAGGVGFASVTENFDFTTPAGKMTLTLIGGVSEFFSDQLAVHVVKGQRQRVESGLHQGRPPFGYRVDDPGALPCIHEQEGPAVRTSFAMRAAGQSNGEIADWLNGQGFRTLTGRLHTAHSVKDMLNRKFYIGVVSYRGEEFRGQHEPLIDETTFALVQGRRTPRGPHHRTADAPRPLLAGIARCARCGCTLHADRNAAGTPMYRERHGRPCRTNRRAFVAPPVDRQVGTVFGAIRLRNDWRERIVKRAARHRDGPSAEKLLEQRRRLIRGYTDGGFTHSEYETRLGQLDRAIHLAKQQPSVEMEEVAALLGNLPELWREAQPDERRRLVAPFLSGVYIDVASRMIAGLLPREPFRALLECAVDRVDGAPVVILPPGETAAQSMELVETGEN
ncbi:MAG: recombinase [Chloroflexota bacterium]